MKHLTRIPTDTSKKVKAYALYVSVPLGDAQELSDALVLELGEEGGNKAAFVRNCVVSGVVEPMAQKRIEFALKVCDGLIDPLCPMDNNAWQEIKIIRMALTGCPTTTNTEFTGELSQEYKKRYGDEA